MLEQPTNKQAEKCRDAANRMQKAVEAKFDSARRMRELPPTRKRTLDSQGIYNEGVRLSKFQAVLLKLADQHEDGSISPVLAAINSRAAVEREYWKIPELKALFEQSERRVDTKAEKIGQLERAAMLSRIPGFFATPNELSDELVSSLGAVIHAGANVLESSAGTGRLIDAILREEPDANIDYFEVNYSLGELLLLKYADKKNVHFLGRDFIDWSPSGPMRYDFAVINPPFENGQDAEHIRKTYELLKPSGVMTAICGAGVLSRSDKKAKEFQVWLQEQNHAVKAIDSGAFRNSGTMVSAKLVRLVKQSGADERAA